MTEDEMRAALAVPGGEERNKLERTTTEVEECGEYRRTVTMTERIERIPTWALSRVSTDKRPSVLPAGQVAVLPAPVSTMPAAARANALRGLCK